MIIFIFFPLFFLSTAIILSMYNHVFDGIQHFLRKKLNLESHSEYKINSYCQDFVMLWRFRKYFTV